MALIQCPECGKEVSDKAATCPNCGVGIAAPVLAAGDLLKKILSPDSSSSEGLRKPYQRGDLPIGETSAGAPKPANVDWLIRVGQQEYKAPDYQTVLQWCSEGRIPPTAQVWHPSLGQWRMASSLGATIPAQRSGQLSNKAAGGCIGAFLLVIILYTVYVSNRPTSSGGGSPAGPGEKVLMIDVSSYKGGFDNVMMANFELKNNNTFAVKDLTIQCTHLGPSGTAIGSSTKTIYETVTAFETKRINGVNMGFVDGQADHSECRVINAVQAGNDLRVGTNLP